jgi:hypothetical protein
VKGLAFGELDDADAFRVDKGGGQKTGGDKLSVSIVKVPIRVAPF